MSRRLMAWLGAGLFIGGVIGESLFAPSMIGWGVMALGFVVGLLAERRWPGRTPLDGPLLLLAVMAGLSLLITAFPEVTRVQVLRLAAGLVGCYGLINWAHDRRRLFWLAAGLVVGGTLLALLAPVIVDWNRTKTVLIPSIFYEHFPLLVSDAVHPNIMAALLVSLFPLPLAWFLFPATPGPKWKKVGQRVALGAAFLLMAAVLVLTKSRGGYIAAAGGGLLVVWLSGKRREAFLLTLVMVVGIWLLITTESQTPELVEEATDPSTWAFRQQVWQVALMMLSDFPFTGVGMGTFNDVAELLYPFRETQNPGAHNLYLQVGVDLGLPGLIAYLSTLMLTLWMAVAALKTFGKEGEGELRAVTAGALAGIVALMIHGLVDVTVWNTRAAFVPWLVIGLITALYRTSEVQAEKGKKNA